jgi:hypothetical protein
MRHSCEPPVEQPHSLIRGLVIHVLALWVASASRNRCLQRVACEFGSRIPKTHCGVGLLVGCTAQLGNFRASRSCNFTSALRIVQQLAKIPVHRRLSSACVPRCWWVLARACFVARVCLLSFLTCFHQHSSVHLGACTPSTHLSNRPSPAFPTDKDSCVPVRGWVGV